MTLSSNTISAPQKAQCISIPPYQESLLCSTMEQKIDKTHLNAYCFSMGLKKETFEILDHTADLGIVVNGGDLKDLFENAAHAMMRIMLEQIPEETGVSRVISVKGTDLPDLMVRWLGEILYLFEGESMLVTQTKIHDIAPDHLVAHIKTVPFSSSRHEILTEIKAVTYHQIDVTSKGELWQARIIFDL